MAFRLIDLLTFFWWLLENRAVQLTLCTHCAFTEKIAPGLDIFFGHLRIQHPTAIAETTIAETTTIEDKLSEKTTVLEEIQLDLLTGFEDTTALEDKKNLTVFSALAVVGYISYSYSSVPSNFCF